MTVTAMPQTPEGTEEAKKRGPGKKKLIVILVAVLALSGGGYWFMRPAPEVAAQPGKVIPLEPIQVNLTAGHYLRVGIALQLTTTAHEVDGSKALDAAIERFSGLSINEANDPAKRAAHKEALTKELAKRYHHDVMEVYFTEFVTQ